MTGSGLLTTRCDPYGAESQIRLLGGLYPESHVGRIMWHCANRADAGRFRMICVGGYYGQRRAPDGGLVAAYRCDGGHASSDSMPLCTSHRVMIAKRQSDFCPACGFPPPARALAEAMTARQADITEAARLGLYAAAAKLADALDDLRAQMNDLVPRGIVHNCPLRLEEVS